MLLLLGGGGAVVAVGAVGLIVEQLLNKSTPSTVTSSPSSVPATSSSGGQSSTTSSQPTQSSTTSSQPTQSTPTRPSSPGHTGTVIARVADVPLNGAKTFPLPSGGANPGILVHLQDGKFVAFDTSCVVQGPAKSPLAPVQITVNADGTITVR
jgi:hypothetical protein